MLQSLNSKVNQRFLLSVAGGSIGLLLLVNSTHAQTTANQPLGLKVGINAMYTNHGFTDYDNDIKILPSVFYDDQNIYARGNQLGLNLIKNKQHEVSFYAQYTGASYDTDNVNTATLKQLDDKDSSILVGGSYLYTSPYGGIRTQLATDALNKHNGSIAKVSYIGRYKTDNLVVYPSIGLQWQDDKYNDYYYGISEKEAANTGINSYEAGDSLHPYMSVMAMYDLNRNFGLFFNQSIAYHTDTQTDSPKIEDKTAMATTLGLTYQF